MTALKPHCAAGIIHILRDAFQLKENADVHLVKNAQLRRGESALLEHADTLLPWLWRASRIGIESDFAESLVFPSRKNLTKTSLWLIVQYLGVGDLEGDWGEADIATGTILAKTSDAGYVLEV
jgi:hypothetical protein